MESGNREYTNGEITVFWRPDKCIHATTCYRELLDVFNPRKRPWVNMNGAPSPRIIEIIDKCPTEALTYKWNDNEKNNTQENQKNEKIKKAQEFSAENKANPPVQISTMKDGPYVVQGKFRLIDSDGNEVRTMQMMSFCRCGQSNSMPFCDGYHRKYGFRSED